jgi:hypothetical protein
LYCASCKKSPVSATTVVYCLRACNWFMPLIIPGSVATLSTPVREQVCDFGTVPT